MGSTARATLVLLLLTMPFAAAVADTCNADCNRKCCHIVQITPWDRNSICEPQCKVTCEVSKRTCRAIGVSPPVVPSIVETAEKLCAAPFDAVVKTVIASYTGQTAFVAPGKSPLDDARKVLVATSLYGAQDFDGVDIKFCRLTGNTTGFTYDRDKICIKDHFSDGTHDFELTHTLAHEMFHVKQIRIRGTDNFKCEYVKQMSRHSGAQDRRLDLERDAYEFEDRARTLIALYLGQLKELFGTYAVSGSNGCNPARQYAYVTSSDARLVATDECGKLTEIAVVNGLIDANVWKLKASFDRNSISIKWQNGVTWVRPNWDGLAGRYLATTGQRCKPTKQLAEIVESASDVLLTDECGQSSKATVSGDDIVAHDWKISGKVNKQNSAIYWSNRSVWAKWAAPPRKRASSKTPSK